VLAACPKEKGGSRQNGAKQAGIAASEINRRLRVANPVAMGLSGAQLTLGFLKLP